MQNTVTVVTGTTLSGVFKPLTSTRTKVIEGFKNMAAVQRYARDTSAELMRTFERVETKEMDAGLARIRGEKIFQG